MNRSLVLGSFYYCLALSGIVPTVAIAAATNKPSPAHAHAAAPPSPLSHIASPSRSSLFIAEQKGRIFQEINDTINHKYPSSEMATTEAFVQRTQHIIQGWHRGIDILEQEHKNSIKNDPTTPDARLLSPQEQTMLTAGVLIYTFETHKAINFRDKKSALLKEIKQEIDRWAHEQKEILLQLDKWTITADHALTAKKPIAELIAQKQAEMVTTFNVHLAALKDSPEFMHFKTVLHAIDPITETELTTIHREIAFHVFYAAATLVNEKISTTDKPEVEMLDHGAENEMMSQ